MEAQPPLGLLAHLSLTFGCCAVTLCLNLLLAGLCLPGTALEPWQGIPGGLSCDSARACPLLSRPHRGQG